MAWTKVMPANPVVAVCGATGAVGNEFLNVLHDLDFPASKVIALASARSAGKKLPFKGCGQVPAGELTVQEMTPESFEGVDIALFSAGGSSSLCIYLALGIEMSVYRYSKSQTGAMFYTK